ncbi:MAG: hypothetical protein P8X85_15835, partial [Desulfobacterales bacterium]
MILARFDMVDIPIAIVVDHGISPPLPLVPVKRHKAVLTDVLWFLEFHRRRIRCQVSGVRFQAELQWV